MSCITGIPNSIPKKHGVTHLCLHAVSSIYSYGEKVLGRVYDKAQETRPIQLGLVCLPWSFCNSNRGPIRSNSCPTTMWQDLRFANLRLAIQTLKVSTLQRVSTTWRYRFLASKLLGIRVQSLGVPMPKTWRGEPYLILGGGVFIIPPNHCLGGI